MATKSRAIRLRLLATVSGAAVLSINPALAADADKPTIWIEVGGQFTQLGAGQARWIPDYIGSSLSGPLADQSLDFQKMPKIGYDAEGKLTYNPTESDWRLSISAHFGRAHRKAAGFKQDNLLPVQRGGYRHFGYASFVSNYRGTSRIEEDHVYVDFQAGKDVGIGAMSTVLSAGLRIAQFRSNSGFNLSSGFPYTSFAGSAFNRLAEQISREFKGVGPVVTWDGSLPIDGNIKDGELALDWSANASILFGHQTTKQSTQGSYFQQGRHPITYAFFGYKQTVNSSHDRRHAATVPSLGASLAVSYKMENSKLTFGYRADKFFGALDGGTSSYMKVDRSFYGPFATISIGLGG